MLRKTRRVTFDQIDAMIIAMHVRNNMEDFHVRNLSDSQMKELNPIIRQAIYEALFMRGRILKSLGGEMLKYVENCRENYKWLELEIPDYWELPNARRLMKQYDEVNKRRSK